MTRVSTSGLARAWEASVVGLAAFIGTALAAATAFLFLAPTTAVGSPHVTPRAATLISVEVVRDPEYGRIVVDAAGYALYRLDSDPPNTATCTGYCLAMWKPATVPGAPVAGPGINPSLLSTIAVPAGAQLTYAGHPLYRFVGDHTPDARAGEGSFGVWWLVGPKGQEITAPVAASGGGSAHTHGY